MGAQESKVKLPILDGELRPTHFRFLCGPLAMRTDVEADVEAEVDVVR